MAVLEDVPGIKVTVRINGVDCVEYDDPEAREEEPAQPTSSKYIESPNDAEFTIMVTVDDNYKWGYKNHVLSFNTLVDSNRIQCPIIREGHTLACGTKTRCIEGKEIFDNETGAWSIHGLKFSAMKIIDGATKERIEKDRVVSDKLGLIEVDVQRCIELGAYTKPFGKSLLELEKTSLELSEKALKGKSVSHGTGFSASKPNRAPNFVSTERLSEDSGPIAVFQFKYRSRKALQQELVIPSTPPPQSPTFDKLSEAERDRLARERYEQINEEKHIKKEKMPIIKREFGGTLDLTGDDDKLDRLPKARRVSEVINLTDE
ncbi:hypothetical protein M434DRAFT_164023 [Hypoxylon sp. CO27-5]|nr:hypothetical protein M434DRAFT_164023 [Hypoxylon sp. CO27-5]